MEPFVSLLHCLTRNPAPCGLPCIYTLQGFGRCSVGHDDPNFASAKGLVHTYCTFVCLVGCPLLLPRLVPRYSRGLPSANLPAGGVASTVASPKEFCVSTLTRQAAHRRPPYTTTKSTSSLSQICAQALLCELCKPAIAPLRNPLRALRAGILYESYLQAILVQVLQTSILIVFWAASTALLAQGAFMLGSQIVDHLSFLHCDTWTVT